jgi:serine protease AprX
MNRRLTYFLHESVPVAFGGNDPAPTWSAGFDGRGVNVAVVDSGIDGLHPDLENRVVANFKMVGDQAVECPGACNSDITGGHGTHVAGIVAGDGTFSSGYYRGMAPGAGLVGYSTGEGPSVLFALESFDHILANNARLKISVVNNSWGPAAAPDQRFDATDPVNVATKKMHDAGISVVFAAGNDGSGSRREPPQWEGGSDCAPGSDGTCAINMYSVAPWTISVGNTRKDNGPKPGDQALAFSSSRGDPVPEKSADGSLTIDYMPTLSAPGTNIWSARDHTGTTQAEACLSAEAPACVPPAGHPEYTTMYMPLSGTSMAAPHVAGAIAVLQSYAIAKLGRSLTPDEVKQILAASAAPMPKRDLLWDWPCGSAPIFVGCGETQADGMTGQPYQRWQVGAGALDTTAAMAQVDALAAGSPAATAPAEPAPAGSAPAPAQTVTRDDTGAPAPTSTSPQSTTGTQKAAPKRTRAQRCRSRARKLRTRSARRNALRRCAKRYGTARR